MFLIPNFSCLLFKVFLTLNFMYVTAQDETDTGEDNDKEKQKPFCRQNKTRKFKLKYMKPSCNLSGK